MKKGDASSGGGGGGGGGGRAVVVVGVGGGRGGGGRGRGATAHLGGLGALGAQQLREAVALALQLLALALLRREQRLRLGGLGLRRLHLALQLGARRVERGQPLPQRGQLLPLGVQRAGRVLLLLRGEIRGRSR